MPSSWSHFVSRVNDFNALRAQVALSRLVGSIHNPPLSDGHEAARADHASVRLGEKCLLAVIAADDTGTLGTGLIQRDCAAGGAGFLADAGFTFRVAAPMDLGKAAAPLAFHLLAQRLVVVEYAGLRRHRGARLAEQIDLNFVK